MLNLPDDLASTFARRIAERDNPPPPPPLSQEPAAVLARVEAWVAQQPGDAHHRGTHRQARALLALMQHPELETGDLGRLSREPPLGPRAAARLVVRLGERGFTEAEYHGLYRFSRLTRATEDALLAVVLGPGAATPPESGTSSG